MAPELLQKFSCIFVERLKRLFIQASICLSEREGGRHSFPHVESRGICAYISMRKRIRGLGLAAALAVAATVASASPAYAAKKNILHVTTARNANVTVTCGKKKQKKKAKSGEAVFLVKSFKKVKVKIAKKGYLTWEDTYTDASEVFAAYRGEAREYYSSGTSYKYGKPCKSEYVQQYLVKRGRNGQLSGDVAYAFGASDRSDLNGVLTARDGKHTYKTKMKHGMFDFGIIKAGYYRISGEGRYKGKKVKYYGEKSVVPAVCEITAWVSGGHGFHSFWSLPPVSG